MRPVLPEGWSTASTVETATKTGADGSVGKDDYSHRNQELEQSAGHRVDQFGGRRRIWPLFHAKVEGSDAQLQRRVQRLVLERSEEEQRKSQKQTARPNTHK